jgi:hypothetical protein
LQTDLKRAIKLIKQWTRKHEDFLCPLSVMWINQMREPEVQKSPPNSFQNAAD